MSKINISIPYLPNTPVPVTGTIQRIDTSGNPVINVPVQTNYPANLTPNGIDNGQYAWSITPVYPDGRTCPSLTGTTPACPNMIAVSAAQVGNNIVVTYTAPPSVPQVSVTINTPNGGTWNPPPFANGNPIVYAYPSGLYGAYNVSMQCVCDSTTGFFGPSANGGTVTIAAPITNPTLTGTMSIVCPDDCNGQQQGGIQFNLAAPLSADLTVQMALQYTTPTGQQQYGCSIIPAGDITGSCQATGYATFVIPGGVTQVNISSGAIRFATGFAPATLICFCPTNPDYSTIYMNTMFLHPTNQSGITISLTATDTRITVVQI